ncbi:hypothetical protein AVEN_183336-1, partial [Araneus ventricosus]
DIAPESELRCQRCVSTIHLLSVMTCPTQMRRRWYVCTAHTCAPGLKAVRFSLAKEQESACFLFQVIGSEGLGSLSTARGVTYHF